MILHNLQRFNNIFKVRYLFSQKKSQEQMAYYQHRLSTLKQFSTSFSHRLSTIKANDFSYEFS